MAECFEGAYYLAGYALECGFKACIAKQIKQYDFPDKNFVNKIYSHKLEELSKLAGLDGELAAEIDTSKVFEENWALAKDWTELKRYECNIEKKEAIDLFDAITNRNSGVLVWLKKYW